MISMEEVLDLSEYEWEVSHPRYLSSEYVLRKDGDICLYVYRTGHADYWVTDTKGKLIIRCDRPIVFHNWTKKLEKHIDTRHRDVIMVPEVERKLSFGEKIWQSFPRALEKSLRTLSKSRFLTLHG